MNSLENQVPTNTGNQVFISNLSSATRYYIRHRSIDVLSTCEEWCRTCFIGFQLGIVWEVDFHLANIHKGY